MSSCRLKKVLGAFELVGAGKLAFRPPRPRGRRNNAIGVSSLITKGFAERRRKARGVGRGPSRSRSRPRKRRSFPALGKGASIASFSPRFGPTGAALKFDFLTVGLVGPVVAVTGTIAPQPPFPIRRDWASRPSSLKIRAESFRNRLSSRPNWAGVTNCPFR